MRKPTETRYLLMAVLLVALLSACSRKETVGREAPAGNEAASVSFESLSKTGSVELKYAEQFSIDEYGCYKIINVRDEGSFLLVPEGKPVPEGVPSSISVLRQPLDNTYLVATSAMDLINQIGALDRIRFSGTKARDWSIPEAAAAMNEGKIAYAGKYSAPDYELLASGGCKLAIESTMIYHKPEVKDKLLELGIPVFVDYSTYEEHPLGRLEWIKLHGVLFDREAEASAYYDGQLAAVAPIMEHPPVDMTVAFFYVNSNGIVNVRKPDDYVVKMIEIAGGRYALADLFIEEENALSTVNMQMEDFYVSCVDADLLIYNGTIDTSFSSLDDLFDRSGLFRDFKAVKTGRVYFASKDFYQQTTGAADFIRDLDNVLNDRADDLKYLARLTYSK